MPGYVQTFGGTAIYPSDTSYLALALTADVDLNWPTEQQIGGPLIVADIMDVDASVPGLNVDLPDARQASTGFTALFNNVGAQTVTIRSATGATLVSLVSGTAWQLYLTDNSTEGGTWRVFQYGASVSVANAAALAGSGLKAISTTLNQSMPVSDISATPYTVLDSDRAKVLMWTGGVGGFTLPAPGTVGADWYVNIRNSGSGDLTLTPASGDIDAAATLVVPAGGGAIAFTDGTNYYTIGTGSGAGGGGSFDFVSIDVAGSGDFTLSGVNLNRIGYNFTGILTGTRNIIVPGSIQEYWVTNSTTGAFSLFVKTAAQTPGVEVLQNNSNILACDGTEVFNASSTTVSFPIPVAQGGTGAVSAGAARTNLGATAVGSSVFTAANAAAARTAISAIGIGDTILAAFGSAAAPGYSFDGDTNLGLYRIGADNLGIAVAGTLYINIAADSTSFNSAVNGGASVDVINTDNGTTNSARVQIGGGGSSLALFSAGSGRTSALITGGPTGAQGVIRMLGAQPLVFGINNTFAGQISSTGEWNWKVGSVTNPSYAFSTDVDTGMYRFAADEIGFACGGLLGLELSSAQIIAGGSGTVGAPRYTFFGDLDTGMYRSAADELSFATAGTQAIRVDANQRTSFALGSAALPSITFIGDSDTGFYRVSANAIGFSENGDGYRIGYRNIPQNSQSGNYNCVIGDAGKHILHPSAGGAGDTFTIPSNASVAYDIGTVLTFINADSNSISIAISSDTMTLAGTTSTGTRTLGQNGIATAIKVTSTSWIISGSGLS